MSILKNLFEKPEGYLLSIGIQRFAVAIGGVVAGWAASEAVAKTGITIDPAKLQTFLEAALSGAAVFVQDWWRIKRRKPLSPDQANG